MATKGKTDKAISAVNNTEEVTNCDHLVPVVQIEQMIITLRDVQVIVDRDLATLYGVETKALNQAVRRSERSESVPHSRR